MLRNKLSNDELENDVQELSKLAQDLADKLLGLHALGDFDFSIEAQANHLSNSKALSEELFYRIRKLCYSHTAPRPADILGTFNKEK